VTNLNADFIRVKSLEGELKLSQIKPQFGCSITTKEIVFQKPHHSYQIRLADIISMVPHQLKPKSVTLSPQSNMAEKIVASFGSNYYKIATDKVKIHHRQGNFEKGPTEFIVPLSQKMLDHVAKYSNLYIVT
jgi:hypothetical protein